MALDDLEWFDPPPLARRMLRHIDGAARLDEIGSKAGDSLTDAIRLVEQLAREGLLIWPLIPLLTAQSGTQS